MRSYGRRTSRSRSRAGWSVCCAMNSATVMSFAYQTASKRSNSTPRLEAGNQQPTVGMIYSPHPVKDCETGLRAVALLRKRLPNVKLLAFGRSAPPISLRLQRGSQFVLFPNQKQIPALYRACDVWLCSSKQEGFGLPVLEAMACRCPPVSTAVGGPMDFISNGVNGLLVPVGDAAALADAMEKVLSIAEADWRAMSAAAYLTATQYSWEDAADRFEAFFQKLLWPLLSKKNTISIEVHEAWTDLPAGKELVNHLAASLKCPSSSIMMKPPWTTPSKRFSIHTFRQFVPIFVKSSTKRYRQCSHERLEATVAGTSRPGERPTNHGSAHLNRFVKNCSTSHSDVPRQAPMAVRPFISWTASGS